MPILQEIVGDFSRSHAKRGNALIGGSDLKIAAGTTKICSWFLDAAIFMIGGERSPRMETASDFKRRQSR